MTEAYSPVDKSDPRSMAWEAYKATENYRNSKHWALAVQPMIQVGDPDADRRRYSLMPIEQREQHVEGSLWAAFIAGFAAAKS
jgi:hypothetical protein